jgi:hypothetical protein
MEPAEWAATAAAAVTAIPVIVRVWSWQLAAGRRDRERARCDHLRRLPPGSRVVDLGRHGMVIEVGGQDDGAAR